ncbi:MAG TPA: SsrA-binding protein SmpB [Candidatus Paceibacterota bacterium]|nr:SsrA-binding protein SmpB [Candidatus Paceibacterota bacterium]
MNFIENKKAGFGYELQERFEAGIELVGTEVKSIRNRRGNLAGSYISIRGGEVFLIGAEIPPYQPNNLIGLKKENQTKIGLSKTYDPKRNRKLLLEKREILKLTNLEKQKGLTLIPISMYNKGRNIKLEFAIGKGKNKKDKRETIKRRESDREIHRTLKKRR